MRYEKSAGAVVFRKENNRVMFLLLGYEHKSKYLGFPRGSVEPGESEKQTAMREVKEETGLDVKFLDGFRETTSWFYRKEGDTVNKSVVLFLAEAGPGEVKISEEHVEYKWLTFEQAIDQLQFENSRNIMRKAQDFLFKKDSQSLRRFVQ